MDNSGQTILSLMKSYHTPLHEPGFMSRPRLLFQHDHTKPHTACVVQTMSMFCQSPDLSPIEHSWDHLGQRIRRHPNPLMNRDQLVQALRQA